MQNETSRLQTLLDETFASVGQARKAYKHGLKTQEVGTVSYAGEGIVRITGLPNVKSDELLHFSGHKLGIAFDLDQRQVGAILLDSGKKIAMGSEVRRSGQVIDVPVGEALLGRIVDPLGRPLDDRGRVHAAERRPIEREAPAIMDRAPVEVPLQTGLKVVDAVIPIGRGQRELILGDRQTGKTAIALDTIINQRDKNVLCVYCAIGQKSSDVAKLIANLREQDALDHCILVVTNGENPPGLQFVAPYAATSMAEYFMDQGQDVLIVYDDLTHHARSYRELSLLLRRPPAREAYPGDIFYIHSRLLERATHLSKENGGGSLTALPIVETQAQNISAYIPTNLISITDGQIYLSPELFRKGILPAVDVGESVSRVGGKTQLPAYREIAGDLRLSYSQFEELETFARFSTRLDEKTRKTLERGRRVREILKQPQYQPLPVPEQIAVLMAVNTGLFDEIPLDEISNRAQKIRQTVTEQLPELCEKILQGNKLENAEREKIIEVAREALEESKRTPSEQQQEQNNQI
ncbi:alternate F1F0 ATPase, F1 subunit alpha [candidate division KSB1 bacterium]|nr:alternate F1F0 ATPase, F1 subunit alpha [candidate division KSB1 bacterium]